MTKSADVSGVATRAAGSPVEVVIGERARSAVKAGALAAAKATGLARVATASRRPRPVDRLVQDAAHRVRVPLRLPRLRAWSVEVPFAHSLSVAGYAAPRTSGTRRAPAAGAAKSGAAAGTAAGAGAAKAGAGAAGGTAGAKVGSGTAAAKASSTSSGGDWAFLDDPRLSIEDKLFMFMKMVMKKSNDDLEAKMKAFRAGKSGSSSSGASSGASEAKKSSGGVFGLLKKAFPPLAALEKVVPALPELVDKAVSQLGPSLLGALMIPLGAPWAAPLVQKAAAAALPGALQAVFRAVESGSEGSAPAATSGSSSSGVSKESDERMQLLEIERMMQKTNQMFATISNILKSTHDAAMTAVNNIR